MLRGFSIQMVRILRGLLADLVRQVHRQRPRDRPPHLVGRDGRQDAGVDEARNRMQRPVVAPAQDAEAGKAQLRRSGRRLELAEVEPGGVVDEARRRCPFDRVKLHLARQIPAAMERLDGERQAGAGPDQVGRPVADGGDLLRGGRAKDVERCSAGWPVRLRRQRAGHVDHLGGREGLRQRGVSGLGRGGLGAKARCRQTGGGGDGRSAERKPEQFATIDGWRHGYVGSRDAFRSVSRALCEAAYHSPWSFLRPMDKMHRCGSSYYCIGGLRQVT